MKSLPLMPTHFKSPSLGSEPSILPKVNIGSFLQKSNTSVFNFALGNSSLTSSPKASFRDYLLAKPEKKSGSLAHVFPTSPKSGIKFISKVESSRKIPTDDSYAISGNLSPAASSNPGSSRVIGIGKAKKKETIEPKSFGVEVQKKLELYGKQGAEFKSEDVSPVPQSESGIEEEKIKVKKEEIVKDLARKEIIIQLYHKLVEICKSPTKNQKSRDKLIDNSITIEDQAKPLASVRNLSGTHLGGKKVKLHGRGASLDNNSLPKPPVPRQNTNEVSIKQSFSENQDSKFSIQDEASSLNQEDPGRKLMTSFNQHVIKKNSENHTLVTSQYKIKAIMSVPGEKSERKVPSKLTLMNSTNDKIISIMKNTEGNNSTDESPVNYQGSTVETPTSFGMSAHVKRNNFMNLADRIDHVFTTYEKENVQLIEKIKILEEKIKKMQENKKKS